MAASFTQFLIQRLTMFFFVSFLPTFPRFKLLLCSVRSLLRDSRRFWGVFFSKHFSARFEAQMHRTSPISCWRGQAFNKTKRSIETKTIEKRWKVESFFISQEYLPKKKREENLNVVFLSLLLFDKWWLFQFIRSFESNATTSNEQIGWHAKEEQTSPRTKSNQYFHSFFDGWLVWVPWTEKERKKRKKERKKEGRKK